MVGLFTRAIETKQKITVMYIDGNNEITQRTVSVLKIDKHRIFVYCYLRKKRRTFLFTNVLSAAPARTKISA